MDINKTTIISYINVNEDNEYIIQDNIEIISSRAFGKNKILITITIPSSVTQIKSHSFECMKNCQQFISKENNNQYIVILLLLKMFHQI